MTFIRFNKLCIILFSGLEYFHNLNKTIHAHLQLICFLTPSSRQLLCFLTQKLIYSVQYVALCA